MLGIDWRQILLHLFNFAILTGGLYFLLYSPIKKFIEKREAYYRKIDGEANEKLASAKRLEDEARLRLEGAEREIAEKRLKAEAELRSSSNSRIEEAKARSEKIIADAIKAAEAEKEAILDSADKDIIEMTKEASARMVHSSTDEAFEAFLKVAERSAVNNGKQ